MMTRGKIAIVVLAILVAVVGAVVLTIALLGKQNSPQVVTTVVAPRVAVAVIAAQNSSAEGRDQADYVSDGVADQVEIQEAIDSLSPGGGKVILLEGDFNITAPVTLRNRVNIEGAGEYATHINAPGNFSALTFEGNGFLVSDMEIVVGVDGQGETNPGPALMVDSLSQTTFRNLRVIRRGSYSNGTTALTVRGSTDRTVRFESSDFINEVSRGSLWAEFDAEAVYVRDTASPIFDDSLMKGSDGGAHAIGVAVSGDSSPTFNDSIIMGGDGGSESIGAYILVNARPVFNNSFIKGGDGPYHANEGVVTDGASAPVFNSSIIRGGSGFAIAPGLDTGAVRTYHGSVPVFNNSTIQYGEKASYGVLAAHSSSPTFNNSIISPIKHPYSWSYDAADNGRFRPWTGKPWQLVALQVYVNVTHPGVTVSLGTVPGGDDIADQVPLDSGEAMPMAFHRAEIDPDAYIYATPSVPVNNGDFAVQYAVIANYAGSPAIWLRTKGYALFERSTVIANGASNAVEIGQDSVDTKNWKIASSYLETLDPVNQYSVSSAAPLSDAPILLSVFVGGFRNISSLAGE